MKNILNQNHIRFNSQFRSTPNRKNFSVNKIVQYLAVPGNIVKQEVNSSRNADITDTLGTVDIKEIVVFDETTIDVHERVLH